MPLDPVQLNRVVSQFYGNQPHPDAPDIPVKDYANYQAVASRMNNTQKPSPDQTTQAYHLLQNLQMTPAEFERVWDISKPIANQLLGKDPSVHELVDNAHKDPGDIHSYYMDHPDPDHPTVKAGDMAKYMYAAEPIARKYVQRAPNKREVARFAHGQYDANDIAAHYKDQF